MRKSERYSQSIPDLSPEPAAASVESPNWVCDLERRAIALAAMDPHMAASCLSTLPRKGKDGRMSYFPMVGIVVAEVIAASYEHLSVESWIVKETPRYVKARGVARDRHDICASADVIEPVRAVRQAGSQGKPSCVTEIAAAKARREAICLIAPKTVWPSVEAACLQAALGTPAAYAKTLARIATWMDARGVRSGRVRRALGASEERTIKIEHAATLMGLCNAIDDGDTTLDEAFPANVAPSQFAPPRDPHLSSAGHDPRASTPTAATQLARLIKSCWIRPETILEYIGAQGQGTYQSIAAAPDAILACIVRAWPDVVAELASSRNQL